MSDTDPLLDLESRRNIYRHIERNPGLHLRGLQRALDMPLGTIEYHLHQMEKSGLIVSRDDGRFKAFFAKEGLDRRDKDILYYVRQEMPRQIVLQLLMEPGMSHSELTRSLPVSASTCSFHLKKLVTAHLVVEERVGRSKRFRIADADRVAGVIVRYRRSFLDDLVDRFARAWIELGRATALGDDEDDEDLEGAEEDDAGLTIGRVVPRTAPAPAPAASQNRDAAQGAEQASGDGRVPEETLDAAGNGRRPPGGGAAPPKEPPPREVRTPPARSRTGTWATLVVVWTLPFWPL